MTRRPLFPPGSVADVCRRPPRAQPRDVLLAIVLGVVFAAVLFVGWSGGFRP